MVRTLNIATTIVLSALAIQVLGAPAPEPGSDAYIPPEYSMKTCYITSKPGQNCNINSCRNGGGYCYTTKAGRCAIAHQDVIECKVNCRCLQG